MTPPPVRVLAPCPGRVIAMTDVPDPVSGPLLAGCAPQFCYVDDIGSWSTNELTINCNAPLAWVALRRLVAR